MRRLVHIAALVALVGCGGLSNRDLLFMSALPDDSLAFQAPEDDGQALTSDGQTSQPLGDAQLTSRVLQARTHANALNRFVKETGARLREIVTHTPSARTDDSRTWGPFAAGKAFAKLDMRLDEAFTCGAAGESFAWTLSIAKESDGAFEALVSGETQGMFGDTSCGTMSFDTFVWKKNGGAKLTNDPDSVDLTWSRSADGEFISATVKGARDAFISGVRTDFAKTSKGMLFRFARLDDVIRGLPQAAENVETTYQWAKGAGVGRVDVVVSGGNAPGPVHVSLCWGGDCRFDDPPPPGDDRSGPKQKP